MNKKPENIRLVPQEESGVWDGVEAMVNSSVSKYTTDGKRLTGIASTAMEPCKLLASYTNGVVTLSVRSEEPFAVSVRIDELMAVLKAAAESYHTMMEKGKK